MLVIGLSLACVPSATPLVGHCAPVPDSGIYESSKSDVRATMVERAHEAGGQT